MKKFFILILAIIISYAIPYGFAKVFSNILIESFSGGEAAHFMIGVFSHRVAQSIISILLFLVIFYRFKPKMGFNFDGIALYWKGNILLGSRSISHAALLSIPLFALSHIQVEWFPFSIIGFDQIQLGLTMFTGLLFAYAYEKTKNLIVPILLHGYTNLTITLVAYLTLGVN